MGSPDRQATAGPVPRAERTACAALLVASALLFAALVASSPLLPFFADEVNELHMGGEVAAGTVPFSPGWQYYKTPLFSLLAALAHLPGGDGVAILLRARLFMLPVALGGLVATWAAGVRAGGRLVGALAVFGLASCTTWLDWAGRLKTDAVTTALWAVVLAGLLAPAVGRPAVLGGLLCLALLFTQKAVFFVVAAAAMLLVRDGWRRGLRDGFWCFVGGAAVMATYLALFSAAGVFWPCLKVTFLGGLQGTSSIYGTWRWVVQEALRNPCLVALSAAGLASSVVAARGGSAADRSLAAAHGVLLASVVVFPDRWPYFLVMLLPTTALLAALALVRLCRRIEARWGARAATLALGVAALGLGLPATSRVPFLLAGSPVQARQFATVAWVESVTLPADGCFDGAGLVPTRPRVYEDLSLLAIVRFQRGQAPDIIEALRDRRCATWLADYRTLSLPAREAAWLREHYLHDWGNVFVAGARRQVRPGGEERVELVAGGRYEVSWDGGPGLSLDGAAAGAAAELGPGVHLVSAGSAGTLVLRYRPPGVVPPPFAAAGPEDLYPSFED